MEFDFWKSVLVLLQSASFAFVVYAFGRIIRKTISRLVKRTSERHRLTGIVSTYSTNFTGIDLIVLLFAIDFLFVYNMGAIITEHSIINMLPCSRELALGVLFSVHVVLGFGLLPLMCGRCLEIELLRKKQCWSLSPRLTDQEFRKTLKKTDCIWRRLVVSTIALVALSFSLFVLFGQVRG